LGFTRGVPCPPGWLFPRVRCAGWWVKAVAFQPDITRPDVSGACDAAARQGAACRLQADRGDGQTAPGKLGPQRGGFFAFVQTHWATARALCLGLAQRQGRDLTAAFSGLKGGSRAKLTSEEHSKRTRGNKCKWQQRKLLQAKRRRLFSMSVVTAGTGAPRGSAVSILRD